MILLNLIMNIPLHPKIFHILHFDRLKSVIEDGFLWSDSKIIQNFEAIGTSIGMNHIKQRRLKELTLRSHPDLHVGECVPFYFCPRSVMLYMIYKDNNPELPSHGGQSPIIHLQADLRNSVNWAQKNAKRWAFTLQNAGSKFFEDRCDLSHLNEINWDAIDAKVWNEFKDGKQAEFLMEESFPWSLIEFIGVFSQNTYNKVSEIIGSNSPKVEIKKEWYY